MKAHSKNNSVSLKILKSQDSCVSGSFLPSTQFPSHDSIPELCSDEGPLLSALVALRSNAEAEKAFQQTYSTKSLPGAGELAQ